MPTPTDTKLYNRVKSLANKKFKSPSGIYRSSWIVREYKRRGGHYSGSKKNSGLKRWYKEKWVDLNRPIRNSKHKIIGYRACGRSSVKTKGKYPLCRPSKRVSYKTPKTYKEFSKKSISNAKKQKSRVTYKKNIVFSKKRVSKKRSSKKRLSKKRLSKKRVSKKRSSKKRLSKKRLSKKRSSKTRVSKTRSSKKRSSKKRLSKKRLSKKRLSKKRSSKKRSSKTRVSKIRLGGGFKLPRKYSKTYCVHTSCKKMGFSQKASCRYYKNCYKK